MSERGKERQTDRQREKEKRERDREEERGEKEQKLALDKFCSKEEVGAGPKQILSDSI